MISASEQISLFEGAGPLHDSLPLWRYMKVSSLFLLLEGTSFLPSVAILRAADPVEGDLHPDAPWLNSVLSKLGGKEEADNLDTWLLTQAQEWERRYQGANKMNPDANTAFFVERALICRYEHNYFRGWVVSTKRRGSVSHGISRTRTGIFPKLLRNTEVHG